MATIKLVKKNGTVVDYDTLQHAISHAEAGDRVVLTGKVYEYVNVLSREGTEDDPVIIEGEDPENDVVDGSYVVSPSGNPGGVPEDALITDEWVSTTFNGVDCYYLNRTLSVNPISARSADGIKLWTFADSDEFAESPINFGIYYDSDEDKVYLKCPPSFNPNTEIIYLSRYTYTMEVRDSHDVVVRNLSIINGGSTTIQVVNAPNVELNSLFVNGGQRGVYVKDPVTGMASHNLRILNCKFIEQYLPDLWWSDFKSQSTRRMEGSAVYILRGGTDLKVSGNLIKGFFNGITLLTERDGFTNDRAEISYNIVHDIMDDAIELDCTCIDGKVFKNVVYDVFDGISLAPSQGPLYLFRNVILADKTIPYNRSVGNHIGAPVLKIGGENDNPTQYIYIYNNVLIDTSHIAAFGYDNGKVNTMWFINNIFLTKVGTAYHFTSSCDITNLVCARNLYYRTAGQSGFTAEWKPEFMGSLDFLTPCITDRITGNISGPDELLQVDPYALNENPRVFGGFCHPPLCELFHDSPAINAGINLDCIPLPDCDGEVVDGITDIGAYEFRKLR